MSSKEVKRRPAWVSGMCLGILIGAVAVSVIQATEIMDIPNFRIGSEVVTISQFIPSLPFSFVAVFWQMAKDWKHE